MAYSDLDFNLLKVLEALFISRSVSAAAETLSVTQPSVSLSLKRLRAHFGDELFVRQGGQMVPTAVAERLREPVARIIATVQSDIVPAGAFDPAESNRRFTICLSDLGELTFLPDLLAAIREQAPRVTLQSVALTNRELKAALVDGDVDLAMGYFTGFDSDNLFSQRLFDQTFVCLSRIDHPVIGDSLSLDQFVRADHAIIEQDGRSQEVFERRLESLGLRRHVVLRSPHFMSVPLLISQSDMITTVPLAVATIYTKLTGLKTLPLPFESPAVELKQFWHRRSHTDPGTVWLRRLVSKLFTGHDPTIGDQSSFWKKFRANGSED